MSACDDAYRAAKAAIAKAKREGAGALLRQVVAEPGRVLAGIMAPSEFARRGGLLWRGMTGLWSSEAVRASTHAPYAGW